MITSDHVCIFPIGGNAWLSGPISRARAEAWFERYRARGHRGPVPYEIRPFRRCECCGDMASFWIHKTHFRCRKHVGRNPCLVEGCKRSFKAENGYGNEHNICGTHWRELVPVGSPERRIYNRFFRRAKRFGWTDSTVDAFNRFWAALVRRVRARARGDVDMREINRIMGWS